MNPIHPCLAALSLLAATVGPASGADFRVGGGANCTHASIQAAVDAAAGTPGGDTIAISQSLSYGNQAVVIQDGTGPLLIAGGYATCNDTAPTPGAKTLVHGSGGAAAAVFSVRGSSYVLFEQLDIQQGDQGPGNGGGGIEIIGGPHQMIGLYDTWVRGNQAGRGGGISIDNGFSNNQADVVLELGGDTRINSNVASNGPGGGVYCRRSTVRIIGDSHLWLNTASGAGGGIHADDCLVLLASRGLLGAVLNGNSTFLAGGGLSLTGAQAIADLITVDPAVPARIVNNEAGTNGGGIAVGPDARAQVYDAVLADNIARGTGAAVSVVDNNGSAGVARFLMQGTTVGAPAGAANCAQAEACNRISGNLAQGIGGPPSSLAIVALYAGSPGTAVATFRGTRFDDNSGTSLVNFDNDHGQVALDGALIEGNTVTGPLLRAAGSGNSLVLAASTIAGNTIGNAQAVIRGRGACDIGNDYDGTHVFRSIVWQPGRPVFSATTGSPGPDCFQFLLAHDLASLPVSILNQVGDPQFIDPAQGDYRLRYTSPALDYASAQPVNSTRDQGPRVVDLVQIDNEFGPHDLGAYEIAIEDRIFYNGFQLVLESTAPASRD